MTQITFTTDRLESFGGWSRNARVGEQEYCCAVKRGKSVRIPFKRTGFNRGWKWHGTVYNNGKCLWSGEVPGSIGVRGLLTRAGAIKTEEPVT